MVQEILTYIIVVWAFYVTGRSFLRNLSAFKTGSGYSCAGGCSGCPAKNDLMRDIKRARKVNVRKLKGSF